MFKKIVATSAATCLALQIGFGADIASASDIKGHWAEWPMGHLIEKNVLAGEGNNMYFPDRNVTRAEMATFLVRALKLSNALKAKSFSDVKDGEWYTDPIAIASSYGLINGYDDGSFKPNQRINRAEMASMLVGGLRLAGVDVSKNAPLNFKDAGKIPNWAKAAIEVVYAYELMGGRPGFVFAPVDNATRAEASAVIYNLMYVDEDAPNRPKPGETTVKSLALSVDYGAALAAQAKANPKVDGAGKFVASAELVNYYMNPNNFGSGTPEYYQFIKLNSPIIGLNVDNVNRALLDGKGVLEGQATAFVKAGQQYKINELYLISHALHETGNGTSELARGVRVGLDANGKATMVTPENEATLTDIKVAYNMYGIGAVDSGPLKFGSERAYEMGWFTVEAAVIGGSKFIRERYIDAGKDTLYKMRWNVERPGSYQYATHVQWATIAARNMQAMYVKTDAATTAVREFEVPVYKGQPAASALPAPELHYALDTTLTGQYGIVYVTDMNLKVRSYPSTYAPQLGELWNWARVEIVGSNGGWYKVKYDENGNTGWVDGTYLAPESMQPTPELNVDGSTAATAVTPVRLATLAGVQDTDSSDAVDTSWVEAE